MTNIERYNKAFKEVFSIDETVLDDDLSNQVIENWDSIHQLSFCTHLEEDFDIMLDTEDIFGLTSYIAGKEILKNYDINL